MNDDHTPATEATPNPASATHVRCCDVVRFGGDLELAPEEMRGALADHSSNCADCSTYVSQMTTTRDLLKQRPTQAHITDDGGLGADLSTDHASTRDVSALRDALLTRARLLDPSNAEDLTQRTLEVGVALQRRDSRPRAITELTNIMHTLSDAQARLDGRTSPAVDVNAVAQGRSDSLEDLDSDADEPELFYPDLYPGEDGIDGWVDSPNQWRGGAHIPGPEEVDEAGEVYDVIDGALTELPEPLGELLALVDLQGYTVAGSAQALGLDQPSAAAALARARNHVRGRLDAYLTGGHVAGVAPR